MIAMWLLTKDKVMSDDIGKFEAALILRIKAHEDKMKEDENYRREILSKIESRKIKIPPVSLF